MESAFVDFRKALRGITGFGVTPFHADFSVNEEALRKNASALADLCDVVVALGNGGEVFSLPFGEQPHVGRATCRCWFRAGYSRTAAANRTESFRHGIRDTRS